MALPGRAGAHASLVGSSPATGAVLDTSPTEIVLEFDERVRSIDDSIRLFDRSGEPVAVARATEAGQIVTASLPGVLVDGAYLVSWQVVSDDGHPIRGSFAFSVGVDETIDPDVVAGLTDTDGQPLWDLAGWITRFLAYAGALLAAGLTLLYSRLPRDTANAARLLPWMRGGAWVSLAAIGANLLVQGVRLTSGGIDALADPDALELALRQGGGIAALVSGIGLVAITIAAGPLGHSWWTPGSRAVWMLPAAGLVPLGFALAGHTVTSHPRWLVTLLDAVHTAAGSVWFGGLVGVALLLRGTTTGRGEVVARFSGLAAAALGTVAVTGLVVGWRLEGSWSALTSGGHGRVLLAKVAVVAIAAGLGAWNRYRLLPTLGRSGDDVAARSRTLRRIVVAEAVLLLGVIGLTASLVIMPPGRTTASAGPAAAAVTAGPVTAVDDAGDELSLTLEVEPGRPGSNEVLVTVTRDDDPASDVTEVRLRLSQDDIGVGPLRASTEPVGAGRWRSEPTGLTVAGTWTVEVFVATGAGVVSTTVTVEIRPA